MCDKPFFCKLQTKNIFTQNILTKKFLSEILLSKMIPCPLLPVHASKRGGELYVHIEKAASPWLAMRHSMQNRI